MDKVKKQPNGCWIWVGAPRGKSGYGAIKMDGKVVDAHRVSMASKFGKKLPKGKYVCHSCDNRMCVNPAHLSLCSPKENAGQAVARGRM